jgi:hypothetical protein
LPISVIAGHEDRDQPERAQVGRAVVLVERRRRSLSLRGSRRNACTARMPPIVSTKCTITSATVSRVRR